MKRKCYKYDFSKIDEDIQMEHKMAFLQKRVIISKSYLDLHRYHKVTNLVYWWHENDL